LFVLGQYAEAKEDLQLATNFLKDAYAVELHGYAGENVHYILDVLRPPQLKADVSTSYLRAPPEIFYDDVKIPTSGPSPPKPYATPRWFGGNADQQRQRKAVLSSGLRSIPEVVSGHIVVPTSGPSLLRRRRRSVVVDRENLGRRGKPEPEVDIVVLDGAAERAEEAEVGVTYRAMSALNKTTPEKYTKRYSYVTKLLKIAHGLHYIGIGILGIFVVQVPIRLLAILLLLLQRVSNKRPLFIMSPPLG